MRLKEILPFNRFRTKFKGLRVAFIGNQGNNAYKMCKWGRSLGVDAHLFHSPTQYNLVRSSPELIDPELKNNYPAWIHLVKARGDVFQQFPEQVTYINEQFDAIVTTGSWGVQQLYHFTRPRLFHLSLGGDIGRMPWRDINTFKTPKERELHRRYVESVFRYDGIFTQFSPTINALKANGLEDRIILWSSPEDVDSNRERRDQLLHAKLVSKYKGFDRVFLWLSRLLMNEKAFDNKAVDIFIRAAAQFYKENPGANVKIIMGDHGAEKDIAHQLISGIGLESRIDWVNHLEYRELLAYLSIPQAVLFDEMAPDANEISGICRDALSVGCPIVKSIDPVKVERIYGPDCPVLSADSIEQCHRRMIQMMENDFFSRSQVKTQFWAEKYFHYPKNVSKFYQALS